MSVIPMRGLITRLDIPADQVLEEGVGVLDTVLILGYDKDGAEYFAATTGDGGTLLWLVERFKKMLMEGDLDASEGADDA